MGCEWPWPDATPGSVGSLAADAFAAAEFEACCELPCPALLPGALPVSAGSAAPVALAEAECEECCELLCPGVTLGSINSGAADAEFEACCELPCPELFPGVLPSSIDDTCTGAVTVYIVALFRRISRIVAETGELGRDGGTDPVAREMEPQAVIGRHGPRTGRPECALARLRFDAAVVGTVPSLAIATSSAGSIPSKAAATAAASGS